MEHGMNPVIQTQNITKVYPGTTALRNVDKGEVLGIYGLMG